MKSSLHESPLRGEIVGKRGGRDNPSGLILIRFSSAIIRQELLEVAHPLYPRLDHWPIGWCSKRGTNAPRNVVNRLTRRDGSETERPKNGHGSGWAATLDYSAANGERNPCMRHWLSALLVISFAGGCMRDVTHITDSQSWSRWRPKIPDMTPDVVELHYIFVDREEGDPLLDKTLWAEADEQAIPLDMKSQLNANGIRIAKLGSKLSPELMKLLEETKSQGRRHHTHSGQLAKIQATDVLPAWNLLTTIHGESRGDELRDAQGYLHVTPTIAADQRATLTIQPDIEYGPRIHRKIPAPDLSGWQVRNERDARSFPDLRVEMELTSGEYLLVGATPDAKGTMGETFFARDVPGKRRQTVLLVRVLRPSREELYDAGYDFDDFFMNPIQGEPVPSRSTIRETVMAVPARPRKTF